ncbi:PP0621 family protein [Hylemonella sp. W303a]|uniref:PP0621 family protein n=1 Tax=Hylemonella sp. W303a TaxID=3389873 RepID=UPI00396B1FC2
MKFLLFLLIILLAVWLWRSGRTAEAETKRASDPTRRSSPQTAPEDMVRCAHCGLHLPLREAIASSSAHYCSVEHRRLAEPGTY